MTINTEELLAALRKIAAWRKECHAYDEDMGHEPRDFGSEDFDQLEAFANQAIAAHSRGEAGEDQKSICECCSERPGTSMMETGEWLCSSCATQAAEEAPTHQGEAGGAPGVTDQQLDEAAILFEDKRRYEKFDRVTAMRVALTKNGILAGGAPGRVTAEDMALLEALAANEERTAQIWAADHHADRAERPSRKAAMMRRVLAALGAPGREGWRSADQTPTVTAGLDAYFIVAVRRAHNGKVFSFPATYLNSMVLDFEDEGETRPTTGWFSATADEEDHRSYQPLLSKGDQLVAWCEVPQFDAENAKPSDHEGREQVIGELCEAAQQVLGSGATSRELARATGEHTVTISAVIYDALRAALARARSDAHGPA